MANLTFKAHLLPHTTNTYELGSTDLKWKNIYGTLKGNADTATKLATARTLTIGSTGKTFDGSGNVSWSHAEIGATVSNTWTAGTTAGPTIKTTVNGVAGTAVAIPSASKTASGVVTTGAQSFLGRKTFGYVNRDAYNDSGTAVRWACDTQVHNAAGNIVAEYWYDTGDATNVTSGQWGIRAYSPNSTASATTTGKYETFYLPNVNTGRTDNASYNILTSKNAVTIAQGGTGATTAAGARANLGTWSLISDSYNTFMPADGTTNGWYKFGTSNTSYGILPSASGGAGSGHNYIGTSSWYWKYAYIDEIYGHLNGKATSVAIPISFGTTSMNGPILQYDASNSKYGIWYNETSVDKMRFSASGNADTDAGADLCINGNGAGTVTIRGATILTTSNYSTTCDGRYVKKAGDTMTGQLNNNFNSASNIRHYENIAYWEYNSSSTTGTIKIKLPNTTSNCVMMMLRIIIYDYNANSGCELLVSGYTYNDGKWYNYSACPQGTFTKGVRLAYDGTNYCVLLGTTSATWNYSKVILADVYSGYGVQPATGYSVSLITSESGYTITASVTTHLKADKVRGAVFNDYAEYRETKSYIEPGRCIIETGNDDLILSTARLQPGAEIVSDTYGFDIGETDQAKTPVATSGRVLAYIYEGREIARTAIGKPVCSGPNGTVSIMSDEEYQKYGYCAIGTISAIPDYEEWGTDKVKVNGRIWIRIK